MPNTGFIIASSAVNDTDEGGQAWSNPGNVTADDGTDAITNVRSSTPSHWLRSSHDFTNMLPIDAVITGVTVRVQLSGQAGSVERVIKVQLHNGTEFIGTAKTPNTTIPDSATDLDFGGSEDTWDAVLNLIQIGFCNNPVQFGVRVDTDSGGPKDVHADAMWMKLYYGEPPGEPDTFGQDGGDDDRPGDGGSRGDFVT